MAGSQLGAEQPPPPLSLGAVVPALSHAGSHIQRQSPPSLGTQHHQTDACIANPHAMNITVDRHSGNVTFTSSKDVLQYVDLGLYCWLLCLWKCTPAAMPAKRLALSVGGFC